MMKGKKIKILHVLKSDRYSGAENVIITIIQQLSDQFDFIYVSTDGPIRSVLEHEQIPNQLVKTFDKRHIQKVIAECNPDIVHAHDFMASFLCTLSRGKFCLISHLHYDPPWTKKWNIRTLAYSACIWRIRRLLVVSERMYLGLKFAKIYENKMENIGNPLDEQRILKMAKIPVSKDESLYSDLIFVGRLEEQKNPERFIRLVAELKRRGWASVKALMLGEGQLQSECRQMIHELKLERNVFMKEFQQNPYPYMASARILCITSRWEGFGLVAAEADILGIPVLTTMTSGCTEIFGENAPELCRSDQEFIEKIELLNRDINEYQLWKKRSEKRAMQWRNIEDYMANIAAIYRCEALR